MHNWQWVGLFTPLPPWYTWMMCHRLMMLWRLWCHRAPLQFYKAAMTPLKCHFRNNATPSFFSWISFGHILLTSQACKVSPQKYRTGQGAERIMTEQIRGIGCKREVLYASTFIYSIMFFCTKNLAFEDQPVLRDSQGLSLHQQVCHIHWAYSSHTSLSSSHCTSYFSHDCGETSGRRN